MAFQSEQILADSGDALDQADKDELQSKIDALKEALKGQDMNLIKSKQDELQSKFNDVAQKIYSQQAPQGDPNGPAGGFGGGFDGGAAGGPTGGPDGDFQDVNFTDVD